MSKKRLSVLLLTLLCFQTGASQTIENTEDDSRIVQNQSNKIALFRDVSWRVYSAMYRGGSIYTCLPRVYEDKVTFLEESTGGSNYFFKFFKDIIPARWNINTGKTTVWNLDPLDAIDLGIQDANPEIVQSCLDVLPISKAAAITGLSLEWRKEHEEVEKFDITQKLTINTESLLGKINRHRITKGLAFTAGLLSYFGLANNNLLNGQQLGDDGFIPNQRSARSCSILKPVTLSIAGLTALITQYEESNCINDHIRVYELLINSEKVIFNKMQIKDQLKKILRKICRFKLHKDASIKLQMLIAKLEEN